jgi:hypothetical protein
VDELEAPEYVPGSHGVQSIAAVPPVVALYVPAAQGVQAEAPVSEYVPPRHDSHTAWADVPAKVPAAQASHCVLVPSPYEPDEQAGQLAGEYTVYVPKTQQMEAPSAEKVYVGQAVHADAAADENVPAKHVAQSLSAVAPVVALNLPAGQLVQVLPDLYWPVGQASRKHAVAPAREVSPGGHVVHTEAAVVAVNVPAVQGVHLPFPGPNLPAVHAAHTLLSVWIA